MKSILLASASVLAFAGAAAAEISWSGDAVLGYNDTDIDDDGNDSVSGFYWELDIDVVLSQTLDNGLTAGAEFGFEVADENLGQDLVSGDYVLFVESDVASLYFGDTAFAAETHWTSAGDMEQDGFSEADGETVLRGDVTFGGVEASISYVIANNAGTMVKDETDEDLDQLSIGAAGTFGNFTVGMAYQEASTGDADFYSEDSGEGDNGDFTTTEVFGIFASTSFSGADVTFAYADNDGENSTGIKVAYPFGPVTATFYYVDESNGDANLGLNVAYEDGPISAELDYQDDQGVTKIALEGSYDVGNGLVVYAGYLTEDDTEDAFYVGGEMDLGGGAALLVSYAEADSEDDGDDDVGAQDYQVGTTVEVSFEF